MATSSSFRWLFDLFPSRRPLALLPAGEAKAAGDGDSPSIGRAVVSGDSTASSEWTTERAIGQGLKASTWVYACCSRIARAAASVPWKVQVRSNGEWVEAPEEHPLRLLLEKPNPLQSRSRLFELAVFNLELCGNAMLHKTRGTGGKVEELWSLNPDRVDPIPDEIEVLRGYKVKAARGRPVELAPSELVHFMFSDPANPLWGLGPLQVVAQAVDSDSSARTWQRASFDNRAVPDGFVSFKHALSKEQHELATKVIRETRTGPRNARSIGVLGGDATWIPASLSPIEMDFLQSRKLTREEICAVFQVPPTLIGIYEDATLANLSASRLLFWEETVIPLVEYLADELNRSFVLPEYGPDVWLFPDVERLPALRERAIGNASTAQTYFGMGVPFNAINERLGLGFDPLDGGDVGLVAGGLIPTVGLDPSSTGFGFEDDLVGGGASPATPSATPAAAPATPAAPLQVGSLTAAIGIIRALRPASAEETPLAPEVAIELLIAAGVSEDSARRMVNAQLGASNPEPLTTVPDPAATDATATTLARAEAQFRKLRKDLEGEPVDALERDLEEHARAYLAWLEETTKPDADRDDSVVAGLRYTLEVARESLRLREVDPERLEAAILASEGGP